MKSFTRIYALLSFAVALTLTNFAKAQSVLDPNDPIVNYNSSNPPVQPAPNTIGKWVRTPRVGWNTSEWKCYIYNGLPFRLKFPKTYNPNVADGKKYPMMIFFHGLGEAGNMYDNEFQLYHGGQFFTNSVDNGAFDGYIICMQSTGYWGGGHYLYLSQIIDYMVANNKLDAFQVSDNGLSAGGAATWEMFFAYPTYISSAIPMSSVAISYKDQPTVDQVKFTPFWNLSGYQDASPAPSTATQVRDAMLAAGGNYTNYIFMTLGHGIWDSTWMLPDFWPFQLRAYAANPWPLFGRTAFCPGDVINVTLGLAPGFTQYQWRKNSSINLPSTTNTCVVTDTGYYYARVLRGSVWSDWSRTPVHITIKPPTVSPNIQVMNASRVIPSLDGSTSVKLQVPANYVSYVWKRVGFPDTISTTNFTTATAAGDYIVKVTEQFGCSSSFSSPFTVVNANGPNKPDPAINLIVSSVSKTSLRLDWSDNPTPQYNETNFEIYQSTVTGGPYTFVGMTGQDIRTFTATGLNPNSKYFYKVRAVNNTGAAAPSNEASNTTGADTQAPTTPGNLVITSTTSSSIALSWSPSTDDVGVVRYEIYVKGVKSYATTNTSFVVSGLTRGASYYFNVRALDFAGNASPLSNQVSGEPLLSGINYKFFVNSGSAWNVLPNFSALAPAKTGVSSNLDLSPRTQDDNFGFLWEGYIYIPVTGNYIFKTNSDDGSKLYLGALNAVGSPYNYSGTAIVNNDGNHAPQDAVSGTINLQAGTYPIAVAFDQGVGGFAITLSWNTPLTGGNFVAIPNSAFTDQPVVNGTAPANPTNLTAASSVYNAVNLSWTDNSNNETAFEIFRSTDPVINFTAIAQVGANTTTYKDTTVIGSTTYYYRVRAINQYGESGFDRVAQGVDYAYYQQPGLNALPDFSTLTPVKSGHVNNFGLGMQNQPENFQLKFTGTINLPFSGIYTFYTNSDDGSKLYIDGFDAAHQIVNNDFGHGPVEKYGSKNLSRGAHTIYVTYFNGCCGAVLQTSISAAGLPKQLIPDSYLGNQLVNITTPAPPGLPGAPTNLLASGISKSSINVTWTDNSSNEKSFQLYRSSNNNSNYLLYQTLAPNTTSFVDTGLFANSIYYYKVRAVGVTNFSNFAKEDSAITLNNFPVIGKLNNRSAHYGITTTFSVTGTDVDGDPLTFRAVNFPSFASLVNNGNNTATVTLNPAVSDQNIYNNMRVVVNDTHGGADSTQFNLTVNGNYDPTIDAVANYNINENDIITIPLTGHDQNASDVLTWSVTNLPNAFTLTGSNRTASLQLHPNYAAAGTYAVQVNVSDGNGGFASTTFTLTVANKDPNTKVYVRFMNTNSIGAPWNNVTGSGTLANNTNFRDASNNPTTIGVGISGHGFAIGTAGPTTGNNSGVYPDAVLQDFLYFGLSWQDASELMTLTGLDPNRKYDLTFFASSIWNVAADNGSTNFTAGSQTVSLYVQNNTQNTVTIKGLQPAADSTLVVTIAKGTGATVGYINSVVITSLFDDGTVPLAPTTLTAQYISGKGVQLGWVDNAYNETGYEVWRGTNSSGPFNLIATINAANTINYIDSLASGATQYYYEVRAINSHGPSAYSNIAGILTPDRVPVVNPISNVILKTNQTLNVNVQAIDDASDHLTLTASNLPAFATFTDNGDGTGVVAIHPTNGSVGTYNGITITAKDLSDSSRSASFNILIIDKDVASLYLNFSDGISIADKPWNNLVGTTTVNGIKDDRDSIWSSVSVSFPDGFAGTTASGMRPRNGHEVYPEAVMRTALFENTTNARRIVISGLDNTKLYNFVFFSSLEDGGNRITNYTINGQTVTINPSYNINKTFQINGIAPDVNHQVTISVQKATGQDFAVISSLVIQAYSPAAVPILSPTDLRVIASDRNSVTLQWQDRSNNESAIGGFEIWRAPVAGTYALVGTVNANVTSYKDANLPANTTYYYIVRAKLSAATFSSYSNVTTGYTYAFQDYINFNNVYVAGNPWNNLNAFPQQGYVWNNFNDEVGALTSLGMVETGLWAGMVGPGVNTGNNSGIYPDNVMLENWGLFPGQTGSVKITGLNMNMKYDFTIFASRDGQSNDNGAYTIGNKTSILDASLNKSGTVTMYDVTADQNGEVLLSVTPAEQGSVFGLLGALVISGHTPSAASIPTPPASLDNSGGAVSSIMSNTRAVVTETAVQVYPNPFTQYFDLSLESGVSNDRLNVQMFDVNGRLIYQKGFGNLGRGLNTVRIQPENSLNPGVYLVRAVLSSGREYKFIRVIRK